MNKNKVLFLILLLSAFLLGCRDNSPYLNGSIVTLPERADTVVTLQGEKIIATEPFLGYPVVCDSLICFVNNMAGDHFLQVFSLNDWRLLTTLGSKGRGPNEFLGNPDINLFSICNGEIKAWFQDYTALNRLVLLNLSRSIVEKRDVIDSVIVWSKAVANPLELVCPIEDGRVLVRQQAYQPYIKDPQYVLPRYLFCRNGKDSLIGTFSPFLRPVYNSKNPEISCFLLVTSFAIKPDRSKLVEPMSYIGQVNIIDLENFEQQGFRLPESPDFDDLERTDPADMKLWYFSPVADDDYVYILYLGKEQLLEEEINAFECDRIDVFDWEGHPAARLMLSEMVTSLALDAKNHFLYAKTGLDELFRYDIGFLYGTQN